MQQLQELIHKYLEGKCSAIEEQLLLRWLSQYSVGNETEISGSRGILLKQQIDKANGQLQEAKVIRWFNPVRYAAAGIVLIIGLLASWYFIPDSFKFKSNIPAKGISPSIASLHFNKVINNGTGPRTIKLKDGSIVQLQSRGELIWQVPFAAGSRKVELHGKAFFSIAKDKHKPFTVFSGDISTTALGTSFWVDDSPKENRILIKLITGKVVIKEHRGKVQNTLAFLNPGQELTYHIAAKRAVVGNSVVLGKANAGDELIHAGHSPQLVFNNTPLNEVLDRLQAFYHIKIKYDPVEIQHMSFYGEFSAKDHLKNILNTIVIANDLILKKDNNTFIISK